MNWSLSITNPKILSPIFLVLGVVFIFFGLKDFPLNDLLLNFAIIIVLGCLSAIIYFYHLKTHWELRSLPYEKVKYVEKKDRIDLVKKIILTSIAYVLPVLGIFYIVQLTSIQNFIFLIPGASSFAFGVYLLLKIL